MDTTIQISRELLEFLRKRKMSDKESYESIIWDMVEDSMEISEETKKEIEEARQQYKRRETKTLEEVKREIGL